jgi:hypothetical protein
VAGKPKAYDWDFYALIFESGDVLALDEADFSLSDDSIGILGWKRRLWL